MQSIAQAPRGMFCRSMRITVRRLDPRSLLVTAGRFLVFSSQLSLSLISRIYIPMDSNLTMVCPQCNSRAVCKCGYAYPSKRKAQSGNEMKRRRVHKASVRASETSQKTLCRQEMDRVRRAGKRASETSDQWARDR